MGIKPELIPDEMRRYIAPKDKAALGNNGKTYAELMAESDSKLEHDLQIRAVNHLLTYRRLHIVGNPEFGTPSTMRPYGWPDLVFSIRGKFCAIELKIEGKKATEAQIKVLTQLAQDGAMIAVCSGWQEFLEKVREWFGDEKVESPHHD